MGTTYTRCPTCSYWRMHASIYFSMAGHIPLTCTYCHPLGICQVLGSLVSKDKRVKVTSGFQWWDAGDMTYEEFFDTLEKQ